MRRIRLEEDARGDLIEIFEWIARDNPAAASQVLRQIVSTVRGLGDFSTGRPGRVAGTFEKVVVGLPYIIVYAHDASDGDILVLTVRHTSRKPLA